MPKHLRADYQILKGVFTRGALLSTSAFHGQALKKSRVKEMLNTQEENV